MPQELPDAPGEEARHDPAPQLLALKGAIGAGLALLALGLIWIQVARHDQAVEQEARQSTRTFTIPAPRGRILDRDGKVLAEDRTIYHAAVDLGALREVVRARTAAKLRDSSSSIESVDDERSRRESTRLFEETRAAILYDVISSLTKGLGREPVLTPEQANLKIREASGPLVIAENLTAAELARANVAAANEPALRVLVYPIRHYPQGRTASHVLGFIQPGRNGTPPKGAAGVESSLDGLLRGEEGKGLFRSDAQGFPIAPSEVSRAPVPGQDVTLSLDLGIQLAAEQALRENAGMVRGAAVALSVQTGEVLALASFPDYAPANFVQGLSRQDKAAMDSEGAWLNIATQGTYPPGSALKPLTLIAGLRHGQLHRYTAYQCDGYTMAGGRRFPCHLAQGHGSVPFDQALAVSCNTYAIRTGLSVGPNALLAEHRRFHLHEPTGIDLLPENNMASSRSTRPEGEIDTANLAIGQGSVTVSPLRMASLIASLARGETLTVPTLKFSPGRSPAGPFAAEPLGLAREDEMALRDALHEVVRFGLGRGAQVPGLRVAGKSGTAQLKSAAGTRNIAWFLAFAPLQEPRIAIAVAMEGRALDVEFAGAAEAAPVAQAMLTAFIEGEERRTR